MKKIINASIAQTAFIFEEDAYATLLAYITDVRDHFGSHDSSQEIIGDIEARIAEILLERKREILTMTDVEHVISAMGSVGAFDSEAMEDTEAPVKSDTARTLFRDPDNKILGGVSSGIAAFFNIDPFIIRLLFIATTIFGGAGIVVYVLLWIVVPEAKTPSQKLAMRGNSVTLESLRTLAQSGVQSVKERNDTFSKIVTFPFVVIGKIFRSLLPFVRKISGAALVAIGFFSILGASIALALFVTNYNAPYIDTPIRDIVSFKILLTAITSGYVTFVVPFIFVILLGIKFLRKQYLLSVTTGFALVGVWTLAVITLVASSVHIAGTYHRYVSTNEAFMERTITRDITEFTQMKGEVHGTTVTVKKGDPSVSVTGRMNDIEALVSTTENGVLTLKRERVQTECFIFCVGEGHLNVTISTPNPEILELEGGSLILEDLETEQLTIFKDGGSIEGKLVATTLNLTTDDVYVEITGSTKNADFTLNRYSNYNSPTFVIENATATVAYPTDVILNVTKTISLNELNGNEYSTVEVIGGATTTQSE